MLVALLLIAAAACLTAMVWLADDSPPVRAGLSKETPRRLWLSLPLVEIRLYLAGVELYLGPPGNFLALELGSNRVHAETVRVQL